MQKKLEANVMSRNRSGSYNEYPSHYSLMLKKNSQVASHGNRGGLITESIGNNLYRTPVALAVSVTGERTLCAADTFSVPKTTDISNSVTIEQKESGGLESTSEELIPKLRTKPTRSQKRRKFHEKERRRRTKIVLTQRNSAATKQQLVHRCASVQTDPSITNPNRLQECFGDACKPSPQCLEVCIPQTVKEKVVSSGCQKNSLSYKKKKTLNLENILLQCLSAFEPLNISERFKIIGLYILMVMLIFWIASIIYGVDVLFDFLKMATNYVRSFKLRYYRREPRTSVEKYLELLTTFFK